MYFVHANKISLSPMFGTCVIGSSFLRDFNDMQAKTEGNGEEKCTLKKTLLYHA